MLWFLVRLFTALAVVGLLGLGVQSLNADAPEAVRQFRTGTVSTFALHVAILGLVALFLRRHRLTLNAAFGVSERGPWRAIGLGLGIVLVFLPVALGLNWLFLKLAELRSLPVEPQSAVRLLTEAQAPWQLAVMGIQTVVTAPLAEEVLFRGLLYVSIKQVGHPRIALWGTALLFGLSHGHLPTLVPLTLFSLLLTWLYERANNLLAPIAAHAGFNAANFALLLLDR
jgi:membrane protease YdiL (CAAX protease family)